jgi:hypothetical protein
MTGSSPPHELLPLRGVAPSWCAAMADIPAACIPIESDGNASVSRHDAVTGFSLFASKI